MFVYFNNERGNKKMTENEIELIRIIRENDNPDQALKMAVTIILDFLKQHESYEVPETVCLQALA
jgi:hypothetical protein